MNSAGKDVMNRAPQKDEYVCVCISGMMLPRCSSICSWMMGPAEHEVDGGHRPALDHITEKTHARATPPQEPPRGGPFADASTAHPDIIVSSRHQKLFLFAPSVGIELSEWTVDTFTSSCNASTIRALWLLSYRKGALPFFHLVFLNSRFDNSLFKFN